MTFDGAGNTLGDAKEFNITSTTQTFTDWVGSTDTNDYYRFRLGSTSILNITLDGLSADADVQLLNSNGEVIVSPEEGGTTAESINRTMQAGDYYIRVLPWGNANTSYNLNVSATALDFAGNTINSARQITLNGNGTTQIFKDWVGSTDTDDYYRVTIGSTSDFNLELNGLSDNANVRLINTNGDTIVGSYNYGTAAESINVTILPGDYYIHVNKSWGGSVNTSYNLNVSAAALDFAGNTLNDALQITLNGNGTTQTFKDWVGNTDTNDYYRFNLGSTSILDITLNGLLDDADVQLLNSNGEVIVSPEEGGTTAESINRTMQAGDYYIRVLPWGNANTSYNLNVSATALDFAGNTINSARQITLNGNGTTQIFKDWVGSTDTDDYYRVTIGSTSDFNLELNGLSDNANVRLINTNGDTIVGSYNYGTAAESINVTILPGDYYIHVNKSWGGSVNTSYNLNVSAAALDFAGNTLNDALQITLNGNGTTQTFKDWVGNTDTNDYYRFNLGSTSILDITLNGLLDDADVQLLNSNGEVIVSPEEGGTTAESINRTMQAGDYYIRVLPWGNANTSYNLNVSATALDFAGNTINSARQITLDGNGTTQIFKDWVGSTDTDDYYRVTIGSTSDFNFELNGLSDNANLWLLDSNGDIILGSYNYGTQTESISGTILPGDYYILVNKSWGYHINTTYNLNLSARALEESEQSNPEQPEQPNLEPWTQQLGTEGDDFSNSIAVDSAGNVYITGYTDGSLGGDNAGYYDAWLAKYDSSGNQLWKTQLGTEIDDISYSVAVDGSGNIYISGEGGVGSENTNVADDNTWLAKYDSFGNRIWTKQVGAYFSSDLAVDNAGNTYITGGIADFEGSDDFVAWVAKYDSNGNQRWFRHLDAEGDDFSYGVAVDNAGNVYITGDTEGSLGRFNAKGDIDAWLAKYDSSGILQWTTQLGSDGDDFSYSVAVDNAGNVYITGDTENTNGILSETNTAKSHAWLAKYDSSGTLQWTQQLGTEDDDFSYSSYSIAVDNAGNVYLTGDTDGDLGGTNAGYYDAWLAKYDSDGNQLSIKQIGTAGEDSSVDVTVDSIGSVYITGDTNDTLQGENAGNIDAWVAKYTNFISDAPQVAFASTFNNDNLIGTPGNDVLIGSSSNDTLVGGTGNDTLTGYTGGDIFVLNAPNQGVDLITDFSPTEDVIHVSINDFDGGLTADNTISEDQILL
ncbi:MAG: hypothetical protein HC815_26855, partial [Richelia sp. RM1_1_1]|nr:hypothetical protein [Richelia sp. RM1_1_1]